MAAWAALDDYKYGWVQQRAFSSVQTLSSSFFLSFIQPVFALVP